MNISFVILLLAMSIFIPMGIFFMGNKSKMRFKKVLAVNMFSFFGILIFSTICMFSQNVSAAEAVQNLDPFAQGMGYLSAALVTGLSTVGAGIATGSAASSALGAISENESIMGKALIFVALAEGIAIYGLLISFTILGRV